MMTLSQPLALNSHQIKFDSTIWPNDYLFWPFLVAEKFAETD